MPVSAETKTKTETPAGQAPPLRLAQVQNNESVVFLLEMQGYRWLFTGDMEKAEEDEALASLPPDIGPPPGVSIDVMKVAHHGSKTSSTEPWLDRWHPRRAVISVGARNTYGHPAPQVLQRLEADGIAVNRTDRDGAVRTVVGPKGLQTSTRLSPDR
jgi:competence protein ComEC